MGEAKNWKEKLFAEHPYCCFCGGKTPATEIDHQPGRVFFRSRQWPEGFAFTSCSNCNRVSRLAEDAVSLLTSHFEDEKSQRDYRKRRDSIWTNYPELIESLKMTNRDKRNAARSLGIVKQNGQSFAELPLAKLEPRIWLPHWHLIGRKLALAIHYQCHLRPMPLGSGVYLSFSTNADLMSGQDLQEFLDAAPQLVMPMRNREMLGKQFSVRWGASTDLGATVFVANIQQRLIISALCLENPKVIDDRDDPGQTKGPFEW